jgi:hypothetical protein
MQIAHLDSDGPINPSITDTPPVYWKLISHPIESQSGKQVAQLVSVSWLDVKAVFRQEDLSAGRYQVQWRINYGGANPDSVFNGTKFQAVVFDKNEVKRASSYTSSSKKKVGSSALTPLVIVFCSGSVIHCFLGKKKKKRTQTRTL